LSNAESKAARHAMNRQDLLMAAVALLLALLALMAAAGSREQYYRLPKVRWIDERWGRKAARVWYAIMGLLLAALGVAILSGWSFLP
jgi:small neutral amino acid transporter SnatA (MarC family)